MQELSDQIAKIKTDIDHTIERSVKNLAIIKNRLEAINHPEIQGIINHLSLMNNELIARFHKHTNNLDKVDDNVNNS